MLSMSFGMTKPQADLPRAPGQSAEDPSGRQKQNTCGEVRSLLGVHRTFAGWMHEDDFPEFAVKARKYCIHHRKFCASLLPPVVLWYCKALLPQRCLSWIGALRGAPKWRGGVRCACVICPLRQQTQASMCLRAEVTIDSSAVVLNCRLGRGRVGPGCVLVNVTAPAVDVRAGRLLAC